MSAHLALEALLLVREGLDQVVQNIDLAEPHLEGEEEQAVADIKRRLIRNSMHMDVVIRYVTERAASADSEDDDAAA